MFDRILQIIDKCSSSGFDRKTVDEALTIYFKKGATGAENYLVNEKKFPLNNAVQLVTAIEKENNHLDRQAILINSFFFLVMLALLISGNIYNIYPSIGTGGLGALYFFNALRKSISRFLYRKKHPYVPGMYEIQIAPLPDPPS